MLRPTHAAAAAEFKQKSRWTAVWPNMRYGAMYLPYTVGRQLPMKSVNWVTRDSNRLVNFSGRYSAVIADLDVKRNAEELHIPLEDLRWNDHRRIFWCCSFCGSLYRKSISVRTKFHAGCNVCKGRYPSEVLQAQMTTRGVLREKHPELAAQLAQNGKQHNLAGLSSASKLGAHWTCRCCGALYHASIRSRTGEVEEGQAPLHPQIREWTAYCPSCTWRKNMEARGVEALEQGQWLGLGSLSERETSAEDGAVSAPSLRRRKLVV